MSQFIRIIWGRGSGKGPSANFPEGASKQRSYIDSDDCIVPMPYFKKLNLRGGGGGGGGGGGNTAWQCFSAHALGRYEVTW